MLQALIEPAFKSEARRKKEKESQLNHNLLTENSKVRHPNRRKRWSFANLEPMEDKLNREKKRGRVRGLIKRLKDKRQMKKEKKALRKAAMSSQENIEFEAWENSKAELFILLISVTITSLMMLSAFNKIFLWHHMSSWNPMWVQWSVGVFILLGLGVFWHRGAEWIGLNLLIIYLGFWTFILFIPYDPATKLTLFEEKGVVGITPWILSTATFLLLVVYRGYAWWLNISSFSIGFMFGLLLWLAAVYWWQVV